MKKLLAMFLAALCMVLCLVPMTALAETETTMPAEPVVPAEPVGNSETVMPVVTIDVGGANTENENYKIDDTRIQSAQAECAVCADRHDRQKGQRLGQ